MRASRRVLLLAVLIAALAAPAAAQGAATGIVIPGGPAAGTPGNIALFQRSGATWARVFMFWNSVEPGAPGQLDPGQLAGYDSFVNSVIRGGGKVDIVVTGAPSWATGSPSPTAPPQNPADFGHFMGEMAQHFAGRVAAWELWNEEDETVFWDNAPQPALFAQLLQAAYPQIKAADPAATVILGGLTGNDYAFLDSVYSAGGKGSFDAVGVHTDTACSIVGPDAYYRTDNRIGQFSFLGYREVRATMLSHGDDKPIWMTELGWSTSSKLCDTGESAGKKAGGVSLTDQAAFLKMAYHCMAPDAYLPVAIWFDLSDEADQSPGTSYGLVGPDGAPKPAYAAFQSVAQNGDQLTGPCGDFTPPTLQVAAPTPSSAFAADLPIAVSAQDASGVARISLAADGQPIRSFSDSATPVTLSGQIDWQGAKQLSAGTHKITVSALDPFGNTVSTDVTVTKLGTGSGSGSGSGSGAGGSGGGAGQTIATTAKVKVKGSGAVRRVSIRITPAQKLPVAGKVTLFFAKLVKGHYKVAHKYTKNAKKPLTLKVRLEKAKWRVQLVYPGVAPFKGTKSKYVRFTVR